MPGPSTDATLATEGDKRQGPIGHLLNPIRGQLMAATGLAALGAMLTLVPLAGIAHLGSLLLGSPLLDAPDTDPSSPALPPSPALAFEPFVSGGPGTLDAISLTLVISLACLFLGLLLGAAAEMSAHRADTRLTGQLRRAAVERLGRVPLGWFSERSSGETKQVLQDDIGTLHALTAHFYTAVGRAAGAIVAAVGYLLVIDWRLALLALLPLPGYSLFLKRAMRASSGQMAGFVARLGRINSATVEFVAGMPVIRAFGAEQRAHAGYHAAVDGFAEAFTAFTRPLVASMANAHALIAPVTVLAGVLGFGLVFVALGWTDPVEVLPFALIAPGICPPLLLLHTLLHDLGAASAAAQRVTALLETPVLAAPAAGQGQSPQGHEIRFEGVSHDYGPAQPAVSDLRCTVEPGTVTAIVGASGAGKSTLARLLLRFFDPTAGRITVGGVDLRELEPSELYRRIGFVLQEVRLIHASVRDNIALGRPGASLQAVEAAARAARIHERILALPRGYDSVIGDDARLSGGERQRLTLARAILVDAPVLVLDEATAAADADTQSAIQAALASFARGRSLVVIAHRLDTVMAADQILVLDDGAIVEQGRHAELLARDGRYASLWRLGRHDLTGADRDPDQSECRNRGEGC